MELEDKSVPARVAKTGRQTLELGDTQILKIETSPGGAEILDAEVPEGKVWVVYLNIDIIETNA